MKEKRSVETDGRKRGKYERTRPLGPVPGGKHESPVTTSETAETGGQESGAGQEDVQSQCSNRKQAGSRSPQAGGISWDGGGSYEAS